MYVIVVATAITTIRESSEHSPSTSRYSRPRYSPPRSSALVPAALPAVSHTRHALHAVVTRASASGERAVRTATIADGRTTVLSPNVVNEKSRTSAAFLRCKRLELSQSTGCAWADNKHIIVFSFFLRLPCREKFGSRPNASSASR